MCCETSFGILLRNLSRNTLHDLELLLRNLPKTCSNLSRTRSMISTSCSGTSPGSLWNLFATCSGTCSKGRSDQLRFSRISGFRVAAVSGTCCRSRSDKLRFSESVPEPAPKPCSGTLLWNLARTQTLSAPVFGTSDIRHCGTSAEPRPVPESAPTAASIRSGFRNLSRNLAPEPAPEPRFGTAAVCAEPTLKATPARSGPLRFSEPGSETAPNLCGTRSRTLLRNDFGTSP